MLEEFLEDLISHEDRPQQVDVLLEILKELKDAGIKSARRRASPPARIDSRLDRYDIFKMYPDRIVRIGFVRGAENARRVLPSLNSVGDSFYFLHGSGNA